MDDLERRRAAEADFDRQVGLPHGAVDLGAGPDVPTQGVPPDQIMHGATAHQYQDAEALQPTEPHPTRTHLPGDLTEPSAAEAVRMAQVGEPTFDTRVPADTTSHPMDVDDDEPVHPEGDAASWRAKAEEAQRAWELSQDEVSRLRRTWTPPQDIVPEYRGAADHLAEKAEAFVRDMRAAWTRLPNRSRPYEAHAALLEALATYHKARNRS